MNSDRVDGIHPIFNMSRYTNRDHNQLFAFETRCVFFLRSFELAFGGGVKHFIIIMGSQCFVFGQILSRCSNGFSKIM